MKIEEVVECLNDIVIDHRRDRDISSNGHFVLQKEIKPSEKFKAYKSLIYTLWFVNKKNKARVLTVSITDRVLKDQEEVILSRMDYILCKKILTWVMEGGISEQIIKGDYGNPDE